MKDPVISIISATALAPCLFFALPMAKANAHGYVSSPPSRQAQCAQRIVDCGAIKYEPQSVEGRQGQRNCNGGLPQFADLNDDSKPWRVTPVGNNVSFTWTNTALHRTANWEYYIGNTRVAVVNGNNQIPSSTLTHQVNLSGFSGRQKLLAIWNIGDTPNAFYSCVDLQIGGGTPPTTTTNPPPTTTNPPPTTTNPPPTTTNPPPTTTNPPPTTTNPPPTTPGGVRPWALGATYAIGDRVTYKGRTYECRQAHTVHAPNWTPPNTPALWKLVRS
ncbi:lytic polysaccharide monooxygenase [Mycobacterium sp.]|uniref:lytic polysaccharide monooxygenase n=1 Tax=Mycobacterium sp. TaxID=1785 RepID=UPI003BAA97ED